MGATSHKTTVSLFHVMSRINYLPIHHESGFLYCQMMRLYCHPQAFNRGGYRKVVPPNDAIFGSVRPHFHINTPRRCAPLRGVWTRFRCVCVFVSASLCVFVESEAELVRTGVGAGTVRAERWGAERTVRGGRKRKAGSMASSHGRVDQRFVDWMSSLPASMHTIPLTNLAIPGTCFSLHCPIFIRRKSTSWMVCFPAWHDVLSSPLCAF